MKGTGQMFMIITHIPPSKIIIRIIIKETERVVK